MEDYLARYVKAFHLLQNVNHLKYRYNEREIVFQYQKTKLFRYVQTKSKKNTPPILLVFATVNRPEILDLFPETSFIRGLLNEGLDVYLLDWGCPDQTDKNMCFADYVTLHLDGCIKHICHQHQLPAINLLGICQGGIISLCYAAIFNHIKNLILISTPIDFHTDDHVVGHIFKKIKLEEAVKLFGNIAGSWISQFFISLRPFELMGKKYLRLTQKLKDENFVSRFLQMEKWIQDAPDQPGRAFLELMNEFYKENKLIKSEINLNGHQVNLASINIPVLNIMATSDFIVPNSASVALKKYLSNGLYTEKYFSSGHIGIYVSEKLKNKMTKAIARWLTSSK